MDDSLAQNILLFFSMILSIKIVLYIWYLVKLYVLPKYGFKKNLREYGEWAVVTGATDGIGKEYAKQLADRGLNVLLISRTEEKLKKVAEEIRQNSKVEVDIFAYDFKDVTHYDLLSKKLKDLDVGILINNVGQSYGQLIRFDHCDIEKTVDIMNVNMISDVRMTHIVLPRMMEGKKGAVVHVSSGSIYILMPSMNVYSSTKLFMKRFVSTLQLESNGYVDHQLLTPSYVESNMSKQKPGPLIPSAKDYVASAINTIGLSGDTCGYFSHEFVYFLLKVFPTSLISLIYVRYRSFATKNQ